MSPPFKDVLCAVAFLACLAFGIYLSQHFIDRAQLAEWAEQEQSV